MEKEGIRRDETFEKQPCVVCGKKAGFMASSLQMAKLDGKIYCKEHLAEKIGELAKTIPVTSTPSFENKKIIEYLGFETAEIVTGTGFFTEFDGDLADLLGTRSGGFEDVLTAIKRNALQALQFKADRAGANAIVGIDLDYNTLSNNKIAVIASGTFVVVQ